MTDDWETAMSKAAEIEKEAHRMTRKQTSPRISSIAARYIRMSDEDISRIVIAAGTVTFPAFCANIRSMAASLLSQDEVGKEKRDWPLLKPQGTRDGDILYNDESGTLNTRTGVKLFRDGVQVPPHFEDDEIGKEKP